MIRIQFEAEDFPPRTVLNRAAELNVTWDDILWAAVTVGRPNRSYVFRHGMASSYEALFRWSLVRMALEQSGLGSYRLRRTSAARTLDPSEKGAVNYFLGMTFCKLFAAKLLNTPWLLHLDVFRPALNPILAGRSRPDLIGLEFGTTRWHAFECKGHVSAPDSTVKTKAKQQAQRLVSVNGTPCSLRVGTVTYFRNEVLHFYWRDPPLELGSVVDAPYEPTDWRHYYGPVLEILRASDAALIGGADILVNVAGADLQVGIHRAVWKWLSTGQWEQAQLAATEVHAEKAAEGYQPDGIRVAAGPSWNEGFEKLGVHQE